MRYDVCIYAYLVEMHFSVVCVEAELTEEPTEEEVIESMTGVNHIHHYQEL